MYDSWKSAAGAMKDVDAAYRKIAGGATDMGSITDFLKKEFQYNLTKTGGNVYKAMMASEENLKEQTKVGAALENAGPAIQKALDDLKLEDYGILLDQITKTGELNAKATLLSDATGMSEKEARLLIGQSVARRGATGGNAVDEGLQAFMQGKLSGTQLAEGLGRGAAIGGDGKFTFTTGAGEMNLNNVNKTTAQGGLGVGLPTVDATIPTPGDKTVGTVNNTAIQVSGVLDEASIKKITAAIAASQSEYANRQARGTVRSIDR